MTANEISVMWGGIIFFTAITLALGGCIWALKVIGPKMARHQRKMQVETAMHLGMVDAQLQEEIVDDIVARRMKGQRP